MKKQKFSKNQKAAVGFLAAIVLLLGVMFATIIGAVIFFEFGQAAQTAQEHTDTQGVVNASTDEIIFLSYPPVAGSVSVEVYNTTAASWSTVPTGNLTVNTNRTVTVTAYGVGATASDKENATHLRASYHDDGYTVTSNVITYAIIVFAMAALVPLVLVGGLMLKSLGFFGGGGKV